MDIPNRFTELIHRINTLQVTPNRNGESVCSPSDSGTLTVLVTRNRIKQEGITSYCGWW